MESSRLNATLRMYHCGPLEPESVAVVVVELFTRKPSASTHESPNNHPEDAKRHLGSVAGQSPGFVATVASCTSNPARNFDSSTESKRAQAEPGHAKKINSLPTNQTAIAKLHRSKRAELPGTP